MMVESFPLNKIFLPIPVILSEAHRKWNGKTGYKNFRVRKSLECHFLDSTQPLQTDTSVGESLFSLVSISGPTTFQSIVSM